MEIVLAAVAQDGWVLKYAAGYLKTDREIVLDTVVQFGWALRYAAQEFKAGR